MNGIWKKREAEKMRAGGLLVKVVTADLMSASAGAPPRMGRPWGSLEGGGRYDMTPTG